MSGLFITATDTGVGKTFVTAHLAAALHDEGIDVGVWKPMQSGCALDAPESDARVLKEISGVDDELEAIAPFHYSAPLTPMLAAHLDGDEPEIDDIIAAGAELFDKYESILVEGAGGLAAPIAEDALMVDLAAALSLPLLIVARPGLGTINHCLLTIAFAREHGLKIAGVIFNGYDDELPPVVRTLDEIAGLADPEDSAASNPFMVSAFGEVPVLGMLPRISEELQLQERVDLIHSHIDIDALCQALDDSE